jgi:hypothetical protein
MRESATPETGWDIEHSEGGSADDGDIYFQKFTFQLDPNGTIL